MASKAALKFLDAISSNPKNNNLTSANIARNNTVDSHGIIPAPGELPHASISTGAKRTPSESADWEQVQSKKSKKRRKCPKLLFTDGTQAGHALDTKSVSHCILSQLVGGGGNTAARGQDSITVAGRRVDCVVVFAVDGLDQECYRNNAAFMYSKRVHCTAICSMWCCITCYLTLSKVCVNWILNALVSHLHNLHHSHTLMRVANGYINMLQISKSGLSNEYIRGSALEITSTLVTKVVQCRLLTLSACYL